MGPSTGWGRILPRRAVIAGITVLWLGAVCSGMGLLLRFEYEPGDAASSPVRWPEPSRVPWDPARANLVMAVHPHCPCSRASLEELSRLIARVNGAVAAHVLFLQPEGRDAAWVETDLWRSAAMIPGTTVIRDEKGLECARFHAVTSGQVLLYDAKGNLLFNGGITPSRGHQGESPGSEAIARWLAGDRQTPARASVFGCSLSEPVDGPRRSVPMVSPLLDRSVTAPAGRP